MIDYCIALGTVGLAWWLSTGIVLLLNRQERRVRTISLIGISLLSVLCLGAIPLVGQLYTATGALLGFTQGLVVWAWLEMTYLMGVITGPRQSACPENISGGRRFLLGIATSLYHELCVVAVFVVLLALSQGLPNKVALLSYTALWLMRWSAKLNLFLGVRNYNQDWFPDHLRYLHSYTKKASINPLFPLSITLGTAAAVAPLVMVLESAIPFERSANLLLSALLSLAVLEHWFLMYPFGESALWSWALNKRPPNLEPVANEPEKALATVHRLRTSASTGKT
ncbi:MAG: putative photosynthetic complex assembly protein PuhE [Pseudomonadota bacterium]